LAIKFELVKNREVNANSVSEGLLFPTALRHSLYLLNTCKYTERAHMDTRCSNYHLVCSAAARVVTELVMKL